jgi:hypothetical protein
MEEIKIISPSKKQIEKREGLLLPLRFQYRDSIYETYEPYLIVRMMAKRREISIKKLLLSEILRARKFGKKIK